MIAAMFAAALIACAAGTFAKAEEAVQAADPPANAANGDANSGVNGEAKADESKAKTEAEDHAKADGRDAAGMIMNMDKFLDRLMMAESGGRVNLRNARSTAAGPFQFIASTWLMIANKHFEKETKDLRVDQVLALRLDRDLARRAADIYTQTNAAYLAAQGHVATFQNLRLAFLVGPGGAVRVLSAAPDMPVSRLLGGGVISANPFMARLTAAGLIARAARDISTDPTATAAVTPDPALLRESQNGAASAVKSARARISVPCSLALASCRRWLALAERRDKKQRRASK